MYQFHHLQSTPDPCFASRRHRIPKRFRRGQALVEFGIISLLLFTCVIGILTYGIQLWTANLCQQAVDSAAISASRSPLPPTLSYAEALDYETTQDGQTVKPFRRDVYDPSLLVVSPSQLNGQSFGAYMANSGRPVVNRLLSPLMIRDESLDLDGSGYVYRYPGTVVQYSEGGTTKHTVLIPVVTGHGSRHISWRFPVEEMTLRGSGVSIGQQTTEYSLFSVAPDIPDSDKPADDNGNATEPLSGVAAIRINYPYQTGAAFAVQYRDSGDNPVRPGEAPVAGNDWIRADEGVSVDPLPKAFTVADVATELQKSFSFAVSANIDLGPFSGRYGLGRLIGPDGVEVRPYRHVMTFQSIRMREVFESP